VSYYDYEGDLIYDATVELEADENNDGGQGMQFYQNFKEPGAGPEGYLGSINTKFGEVNNTDGILYIFIDKLTANITSLEIEYANKNIPVVLKGGNITIISNIGSITKNAEIILAEE
jgi:hypothetical protein